MLTKQPDYTISELGYPQWQSLDRLHEKCALLQSHTALRQSHSNNNSCSHSFNHSPRRLLPLRETLDDLYKKRALNESCAKADNSGIEEEDVVAQQKWQKNQWNEQQQRRGNNNKNHSKRNQKCRDKAQTAAATAKSTLVPCDLNCF